MKMPKPIAQFAGKIPGRSLLLPLALMTVFFTGWYFGLPAKSSDASSVGDRTIWTCSMHPQIRQPNPGLCPICAMDLIRLSPGGDGGLREIKVTPEAAALMDLRVSQVVREPAAVHVDLFGKIAYDERNVNTTTARVGGRLDRFFVDFTGTEVRQGDHIAEIYSPDLLVAQQDLIKAAQALERARSGGTPNAVQTQERLLRSARERLRLLQLNPEQIDAIAASEKPSDHITLYAPQDGVVTERHVVEGAYVKEGTPLFSVASLKSVWLNLEAYEVDLPWLNFAQEVSFTVEALPGRSFRGVIAYIDPQIDARRRVVKVRVNVANDERLLKPGMFARATVDARVAADGSVIDEGLAGKWISPMHPEIIRDAPGDCPICGMALVPSEELGFIRASDGSAHESPLIVPASAVLQTGQRALVYVRVKADPQPEFEGREIVLGTRVGQRFIVRSGLSEGEFVVTNGAFKLDSELQIRARPSMMNRNVGIVEIPASEADSSLLGQWGPIPRALGRLGRASEDGNLVAAHSSLTEMAAAIDAVNAGAFQPVVLQSWREFSARLKNTIAEAHGVPADRLPIAYRNVRVSTEELGRYLGLPSAPVLDGGAGSAEVIAQLEAALVHYYTIGAALAADDFEAAAAARADLVPLLESLGSDAEALSDAVDMVTLRAAFDEVSGGLIDQVTELGLDRVGNAYVAHCPMAFGNRGADWLTPEPEIRNPYFGAEMLSCGTITRNLSFEPAGDPNTPADKMQQSDKTDSHEGHKH